MASAADSDPLPRKKLRVGVKSERGGVNAAKAFLERHLLVVQEYDTRNDYGKDLVIDLTESGQVTGTVIAAQVKGGSTYFNGNGGFIPAKPADIRIWADSSVPVAGIVWNPNSGELFWANLSDTSRSLAAKVRSGRAGSVDFDIPVTQPLNDDTLGDLISAMKKMAEAGTAEPFLQLVDDSDEVRNEGVFACWTAGRHDPRPLILLRRLLPSFQGQSFLNGMWILNHLVSNPDMTYPRGGWIPEDVRREVEPHLTWTAEEIARMYTAHSRTDPDRDGWRRGGTGQLLWHLVNPLGATYEPPYSVAFDLAVEGADFDAAFFLLIGVQAKADDARQAVRQSLARHPSLRAMADFRMLEAHVNEFGWADVYDA